MGKFVGYILWLAFAVSGMDLLKDVTEVMKGKAVKAYQQGPISHSLFTKQLTGK